MRWRGTDFRKYVPQVKALNWAALKKVNILLSLDGVVLCERSLNIAFIQYRHSHCLAVQQTGLGPYIALIFVKDSSVVIINSLKITVMNTEFLQLVLYIQNYLNYTECLKWPFGR